MLEIAAVCVVLVCLLYKKIDKEFTYWGIDCNCIGNVEKIVRIEYEQINTWLNICKLYNYRRAFKIRGNPPRFCKRFYIENFGTLVGEYGRRPSY